MRFDINLASQPYQDVRRFLVRWGLALLGVALVTAALAYVAGGAVMSWRITNKEAAYLHQQIAERDRQKSAVEAFLNRPENRDTRDRSQFLNALIARKAFSWTEVFSDLEGMVPARLQVNSIAPQVNDQGQLQVLLTVSAPSHEPAIELLRRIEASPHFSNAQVLSEGTRQESNVTVVQTEISAIYIPRFARPRQQEQPPATAQNTEAGNAGH